MQQFQFDDTMFETHFKPWLLRKLETHISSVIEDLVRQFRQQLREIAVEAKADIIVTVGDMKSVGVREIKVTFSPLLDNDDY
jgi:hypothetical protein